MYDPTVESKTLILKYQEKAEIKQIRYRESETRKDYTHRRHIIKKKIEELYRIDPIFLLKEYSVKTT